MQGAYFQEAMGMKSFKVQTLCRCKGRTKLYRPANISVHCIAEWCSSMEIRVHSRLILALYKGCTNAKRILSSSYGHEKVKNLNHFSVQRAHKAAQAVQYLRSLHRRIVQSMAIRVHSRLILSRCKGCTNAMCTLSRSYEGEEFKSANPL